MLVHIKIPRTVYELLEEKANEIGVTPQKFVQLTVKDVLSNSKCVECSEDNLNFEIINVYFENTVSRKFNELSKKLRVSKAELVKSLLISALLNSHKR